MTQRLGRNPKSGADGIAWSWAGQGRITKSISSGLCGEGRGIMDMITCLWKGEGWRGVPET